MTNHEFCSLAAHAIVSDLIDAQIVYKDRAADVEGCIRASLQTAVQHALLEVRSRIEAAVAGINLMPEPDSTEAELIAFVTTHNHPDQ